MVIDTSALVCMLLQELEAPKFLRTTLQASRCILSAPSWLETAQVLTTRRGAIGRTELGNLLAAIKAEIVPFDLIQAQLAYDAWLRYGKGRHPAGLNFGDCFSYALAKLRAEPLLFKGDDFSKTDIAPAV